MIYQTSLFLAYYKGGSSINIKETLLNLIYPPVCGFCNEVNYHFLCKKCENKLINMKKVNIDKYKNQQEYYDEHFYLFKYHDYIRDLIIKYKFDEKSYLYKSFSEIITRDEVFKNQFICGYDVIIAVPIHTNRMKERGYNQSELIAKTVAANCGKLYYKNVLLKKNNVVAQSSLEDKNERIENIKDCFDYGVNIQKIKGKKVALFDDVFTTGATVNECSKVLKKYGAKTVGVFTLTKS